MAIHFDERIKMYRYHILLAFDEVGKQIASAEGMIYIASNNKNETLYAYRVPYKGNVVKTNTITHLAFVMSVETVENVTTMKEMISKPEKYLSKKIVVTLATADAQDNYRLYMKEPTMAMDSLKMADFIRSHSWIQDQDDIHLSVQR